MEAFQKENIVKDLHFGEDGKNKVITGIDKLNKAVSITLGASGRNALIEDQFGNIQVTKDGVSVASYVSLHDAAENVGCTLLKQASKKTADKAGDGTTTSTVLAHGVIHEYLDLVKDNSKFRGVKSGVEKLSKRVIEELDKKTVEVNADKLKDVSIISANNDEELGTLIANAFESAGIHGVVSVQNSEDNSTYIEVVEGTHLRGTCEKPHFFTDQVKSICELDNPLIFLSADSIENVREIQQILEHAIKSNRSILIIAPLEAQPMAALAMNKLKGNIKVNVIPPPSFGLKQKDLLSDLSLLTGAKVIDVELGDSYDRITPDVLGNADKAISDKDGTTLIVNTEGIEIDDRIEEIKAQMDQETEPVIVKHCQDRLALLTGGVSILKVGADTEVELNEKKDRVDDAVHAVRAAKKEGILPGGGSALHYLGKTLEIEGTDDEILGSKVLKNALFSPFNTILKNAGLDPMTPEYNIKKWGQGVDVIDGKVKDMIEEGIIDPTLVTKEALRNAVSVALTVLSTEVLINNVRTTD